MFVPAAGGWMAGGFERINVQQSPDAPGVDEVLKALRRYASLVVLCAVVVSASALVFAERQPKRYRATASLVYRGRPLTPKQVAALASSQRHLPEGQANEVDLVKGGGTVAKTAARVGRGLGAASVARALSISGGGENNIVAVSATTASPRLAAEIANTYARLYTDSQRATYGRSIAVALGLAKQALVILGRNGDRATLGTLRSHIKILSLLKAEADGYAAVAQEASIPAGPSSPKIVRKAATGLLVGLLLGLELVLMLTLKDKASRDGSQLPLAGGELKGADAWPAWS